MLRDMFAGYAQRIRLENSLQLQRAKLIRPPQVRLEVAKTLSGINTQLAADPDLQKVYDTVVIEVPA